MRPAGRIPNCTFPGLEGETETELRAVRAAGPRPEAGAGAVWPADRTLERHEEGAARGIGLDRVALVEAVGEVVELPEEPQRGLFAELEALGGGQVELEERLDPHGVRLYLLAAGSSDHDQRLHCAAHADAVNGRPTVTVYVS